MAQRIELIFAPELYKSKDKHPFMSIADFELIEIRISPEPNVALSYKLIKEVGLQLFFIRRLAKHGFKRTLCLRI